MVWSDEERRAYQREYYHKHREKILGARTEEAKQANRDRAKKWYHENKDYVKEIQKQNRRDPEWRARYEAGREKRRLAQRKRREAETPEEKALRLKRARVYLRALYQRRVAQLDRMKRERGCRECGKTDPRELHWHHRNPAEKAFRISPVKMSSMKKLMAEIAKCDVLCKDCHRKEHQLMRYGEVEY